LKIRVLEKVQVTQPVVADEEKSAISLALTTIPIPNPFKSKRPRISKPLSVYNIRNSEDGLVELDSHIEFPDLGFPERVRMKVFCSRLQDGEEIVIHDENIAKVRVLVYSPWRP
jgi:hypothetical protein